MPTTATELHHFISTSLGMSQFPVGTEESQSSGDQDGDHIMGVTVIAWLTRFPIDRWGEAWATQGSFEIRFRAHLTAGLELVITVETADETMAFTVAGLDGQVYATASAARSGGLAPRAGDHRQVPRRKVHPVEQELRDRVLIPLQFGFDAERDLAFASTLSDRPFWCERGWAHPAWLASAANAIIRRNVAFAGPGHWLHAGLELSMHAPTTTGSLIEVGGCIEELFTGRRHRFAVAALDAFVRGEPVMTMRNTFAYASTAC